MVKDKNYNHKELAVLKHQDIVRMKVVRFFIQETIRKPTKEEEELEKGCVIM